MGNKRRPSFEQEFIDSFVSDEVINWKFDPILLDGELKARLSQE
ncbi:uncharacterized protein Eint_091775 [Encephalitozoon intestinalis ATCC 50506]|uniref:Uncharacterized protein n=1 Tax=Encephalitozoon intestinalis (strain ATCC 50506) TaxID=876142 RepID=W8PKK5_ENCIT|nr:uncharacterized protein Eint_091775 [Encephalitozoon intestinalis ATCC 50506]AHL30155.1 hypothetical protein Eint_091775 [Encephalitozoon intestinalis ATCC 50506]UTX46117.1 hypothetical protein GPK93_09g17050 [Encephalitozoon intestinalis]